MDRSSEDHEHRCCPRSEHQTTRSVLRSARREKSQARRVAFSVLHEYPPLLFQVEIGVFSDERYKQSILGLTLQHQRYCTEQWWATSTASGAQSEM